MTRHNNPDTGVANRMTWTVTSITDTGIVQLVKQAHRATHRHHHLHLAYAAAVHGGGAQVTDKVLSGTTDAPALYLAMTRGRQANTIHVIADNFEECGALQRCGLALA